MSKTNENGPVTEKLCVTRRQTVQEQIDGLKKTIYAVGVTTTLIIVIVQFLLTYTPTAVPASSLVTLRATGLEVVPPAP